MNNAGIPCSLYTTTKELCDHPQIAERGPFKQLYGPAGPFKIHNPPFQFARSDTTSADSVPELGEHTTEVLEQILGYDLTTIKQLCDSGAAYKYASPTPG